MDDNAQTIDNYEIIETVLNSAEGIIYRAVEKSSSQKVLLKQYYPSMVWSDEILDEFFTLASYLRFIEHESLLPILDMGRTENRPYIVFADSGVTLLRDQAAPQDDQTKLLSFLHTMAEGLDFLHKQEIIHGSLSIDNIVVDENGYPLLFDFGLSGIFKKLLLENMDDGFENLSIANLRFTAPELILGRSATRASDIYAFGIVTYFCIFNQIPVGGQYVPEIALAHFEQTVSRLESYPSGSLRSFLPFIQKCIQVEFEERFRDFTEVMGSLDRIRAGKRVRLKFKKRIAMPRPRMRVTPAYMGVALLVLGISISYYFYAANQPSTPVPTATITVTQATERPTETRTPDPRFDTPTATLGTVTPTAEADGTFRLAFEAQTPLVATDPISVDNIANLQEISRLGYGKPEEADVAPDGTHVAVATSAGVAIFNINEFVKWIDPQGWATSVQFSRDGKTLAVGGATGEIQLWDWEAGTQVAKLTGHTRRINRILFSQNNLLFSASDDQNIMVWDLKANRVVQTIHAHSQPVNDIAVTSDARVVISCSDDRLIRVWDLASGDKLYEMNSTYFTGTIKAIDITEDDAFLAAGSDAGYLYQWTLLTSLSSTHPVPKPRSDIVPVQQRIWSVEYTRDDQELLVGIDNGKSVTYDATRKEFEGISLSFELPSISLDLVDAFGSSFKFNSFAVYRNGSVVSLNWDGVVTNQQQQLANGMYDLLDRLDFSPDGTVLAAGGRRGSTHVWNLTTNEPLYQNLYYMPSGDPLSRDNSSITLIVPQPTTLRSGNILNIDTYQLLKFATRSTTALSEAVPDASVGYSENGSIVIAASLSESKAWDYGNGNETRLNGYRYTGCWITSSPNDPKDRLQVNSVVGLLPPTDEEHINSLCPKSYQFRNSLPAVSRDLNLLVYVNSNGLLESYDVLQKTSPWPPYRVEGMDTLTALAVSPDGSMVAIGDASGKLLLLNGKTGEPIHTTTGDFGRLRVILFSEDGTKLATTGDDGLVHVFGIVDRP